MPFWRRGADEEGRDLEDSADLSAASEKHVCGSAPESISALKTSPLESTVILTTTSALPMH